jgi:hypothetical protein
MMRKEGLASLSDCVVLMGRFRSNADPFYEEFLSFHWRTLFWRAFSGRLRARI